MADSERFDAVMRVLVVSLLAAILGFGGFFGYTVYRDRRATEDANPALRTIKESKEKVTRAPNDASARIRLGEAYAAANKSQQAIEQFNAALKINPKHSGAYLDLGLLAMASERPNEGKAYLKEVVDLIADKDPMAEGSDRLEIAYFNLGKIEMDQHNYEVAVGYFKQALRIRSDASDTYLYVASCLDAMGQPDEAKRNLDIALRFDPNFSEARYLLAKLLLAEGDKVRAAEELGKSLRLSPSAPEPQELSGRFGDTADYAKKALALAKTDPDAAIDAASIAFNLAPLDNLASGKLQARLLLKQGRKKTALSVYRSIAEVFPNDREVEAAITRLSKTKAGTATKN